MVISSTPESGRPSTVIAYDVRTGRGRWRSRPDGGAFQVQLTGIGQTTVTTLRMASYDEPARLLRIDLRTGKMNTGGSFPGHELPSAGERIVLTRGNLILAAPRGARHYLPSVVAYGPSG